MIGYQFAGSGIRLGRRPWRRFVDVTLPLAVPGIVAGSLLVFIPAVGEYVIPALMGGADTIMVGRVLFDEFFLQPRLGGCLSGGDGATNRAGRAHYVFPTPTSKKRSMNNNRSYWLISSLGLGSPFYTCPSFR
ncbi:MAG: ABC transporter permease subunit [Candidatus Zeuxoniibacter abyssi]|nr:MAG: ABC transporter permease subunit [Candidatus Persebacteraceae bacterium AB1(2)]